MDEDKFRFLFSSLLGVEWMRRNVMELSFLCSCAPSSHPNEISRVPNIYLFTRHAMYIHIMSMYGNLEESVVRLLNWRSKTDKHATEIHYHPVLCLNLNEEWRRVNHELENPKGKEMKEFQQVPTDHTRRNPSVSCLSELRLEWDLFM
jgi:hypothetical protein